MDSNSSYYVDPWDDSPYYPQAGPSVTGPTNAGLTTSNSRMMLANPYDDHYPDPVVNTYSHIDSDHQCPYPEILSPSRKRERSYTPSSLDGSLQSNEIPSKRKKRARPHKKKEARKEARAEAAAALVYSQPFPPAFKGSTESKDGNNGAVNSLATTRRLQVDVPVDVSCGPTHRIVLDPPAPPCLQYFHATESTYAATLCRDAARWSTTHQDDISVPTSTPSRILLSDLQALSSSKCSQTQLIDPPRKLVVLDLNGSLLWRTSLKTNTGPRKTFRRPYVGVLAQYLAHERTTQTMVAFPNQPGQRAVALEWYTGEQGKFGRRKGGRGEAVTVLAPLDAMIWSSVQPQNVGDMVDVAFGWLQAALRAVWTRSMIGLSQAAYYKKTQTIKDLRRVWWDTKEVYTVETTTLVDDSPLKACLQPHNLLLIPEYIRKTQGEIEMDPDPDRILLAMIGILEEMRSQNSIPAWICGGGLWGPKGLPASTAALAEAAEMTEAAVPATCEDGEGGAEDAKSDMSLSSAGSAPELGLVALQWWGDEEVVQHWVERATLVLNEMSIPVVPGILDPREDTELAELRSRRRGY